MSYDIIYPFRLFPQDQTSGLEPDGGTAYNCIYLSSVYGYHFADNNCDYAAAALCEAPLEALSDAPA